MIAQEKSPGVFITKSPFFDLALGLFEISNYRMTNRSVDSLDPRLIFMIY